MLYVELAQMPFDRATSDGQFIHATGMAIVDNDGYLEYLYEGDQLPEEDDLVITEAEYERYRRQW